MSGIKVIVVPTSLKKGIDSFNHEFLLIPFQETSLNRQEVIISIPKLLENVLQKVRDQQALFKGEKNP